LILQADALSAQARGLADLRQVRIGEHDQATREEARLRRELEQPRFGRNAASDSAELERARDAAVQRLRLVREEDAELLRQIEAASALRSQAKAALGAILAALPDGSAIELQTQGRL
jgi:hypothetical protein